MGFLSYNSLLGRISGKIGNIVIINLLFLFMCIPIFTIGASFSGMYYACLKNIRYKDSFGWRDFWRGFRVNFKQATIIWGLLLFVGFILLTNYRICVAMESAAWDVLYYITIVAMIAVLILAMYIFPVIAAFENRIKVLVQHCFFFAGKNIAFLLLIAFANIFPIYFTYSNIALMPLFAFCWFFFGFSFVAYFNSCLFYKLFRPYLPEADTEEEN